MEYLTYACRFAYGLNRIIKGLRHPPLFSSRWQRIWMYY